MSSGERRSRSVYLWPGLILLLIGTGCAPLSSSFFSRLADNNIEGYEAPGTIDYSPALLEKAAKALAAQGRYRRGPVYGIAMQDALRGLQAERDLPVTGRFDTETLLALDLDPALLPGGLPSIKPDPVSQLVSNLKAFVDSTKTTRPSPPEHSPGRFSAQSPLSHLAAPVAVLVTGKKPLCTGFLIGPDLLLTAASCLTGPDSCGEIVARFNDQEDAKGRPLAAADYRCREILEIDQKLGYGLVRLAGQPGYDWGYLELADEGTAEGESLAVIGHPAGAGKRIYTECRAGGPAGGRDFGFSCEEGINMPGAPVISLRSRRVVAMLRAGRISSGKKGVGIGSRRLLAACPTCEPLRLGRGLLALGNGASDFFLQQGGRLGLLSSGEEGREIEWLPATWLGRWNLPGRYRAYAVDIDGNGADELVLENSEWLAIFKGKDGQPQLHWMAHDQIGNWQLSKNDLAWPGDFNGDGRGDLLMFNGRRLGLLMANGRKLTGSWLSGRHLGEWRFSRADRFAVGDFNGDGRDDVLVHRNTEAALFLSRGKRLDLVWSAAGSIGFWGLAAEDEYAAGDFTGDGCDELLVRRDRELAMLKMADEKMEVQWRRQGRLGSWHLGWQDRLHIADFTGDGRDDVLIRSNEWIGLLVSSGRFFTTPWLGFDRFLGWDLTPFDRELIGDFNRDGKADLLIIGPWGSGRFLSTGDALVEDSVPQGLVLAPSPK
jgi:hypothetical protein